MDPFLDSTLNILIVVAAGALVILFGHKYWTTL
jgi:hypothetical protein